MINNSKIKTNSSVRNYPNFLSSNYKSTSKEKLYSNIPKNMQFNSNKERLIKSPSLKISKNDSQDKQHQIMTNNKLIQKVNSFNNVFNNNLNYVNNYNNVKNNTCEDNIINNNQVGVKLETDTDKLNNKYKINPEIEDIKGDQIDLREITARYHSSTQRAKNSGSFIEFNNFKPKEESLKNANNISPKNYINLLKEKDQEIINLKRELMSFRNTNQNVKPTLSNDIKINDNFLNANPKSFSTSNKSNSKTIFKFDTKINNANEKIEVFSDRSPNLKNMNNFNNFNNNFQNNINLTNRNSYSAKNFLEIFQNYNNVNINNINNINNNLSNSTNFTSAKPNVRSNSTANNHQKNFSSTFSNFFRKSNKKNIDNYNHGVVRDGVSKSKSSNKNLSKGNTKTTSNLQINSNSNNTNSMTNNNTNSYNNNVNYSNNAYVSNNQNYVNSSNLLNYNYNNFLNFNNNKGNESNFNSEKASKKNTKNYISNDSNEILSNFSDIVNFDDINNVIKKSKTNEVYIHNPYINLNNDDLRKKSSSKLEIKDLDVNENNFKNLNNFSQKNSTHKNRNSIITNGKNLTNITSYSLNEKENQPKENSNLGNSNLDFIRKNSSNLGDNNININKNVNCINYNDDINSNDLFERLNILKLRTKQVLSIYAENFSVRK